VEKGGILQEARTTRFYPTGDPHQLDFPPPSTKPFAFPSAELQPRPRTSSPGPSAAPSNGTRLSLPLREAPRKRLAFRKRARARAQRWKPPSPGEPLAPRQRVQPRGVHSHPQTPLASLRRRFLSRVGAPRGVSHATNRAPRRKAAPEPPTPASQIRLPIPALSRAVFNSERTASAVFTADPQT